MIKNISITGDFNDMARPQKVVATVVNFTNKMAEAIKHGVTNDLFDDLKVTALMLQEEYTDAEAAAVRSAPELQAISDALPDVVAKIETDLEKVEAAKQLAMMQAEGVTAIEKFLFFDRYKSLVHKEWDLYRKLETDADLRKMHFVFAGCGAMPMTAIGMAQDFGVKVDCYDIDGDAAKIATKMVAQFGLSDKVKVYHGNALEIDYGKYDVVVVANLARPQMKILQNIAKHENVKALIVRRVNGLVSLMYASFDPKMLPEAGLEQVGTADPKDKRSVHQSVLLKRKMS